MRRRRDEPSAAYSADHDLGEWLATTVAGTAEPSAMSVLEWRLRTVAQRPPLTRYIQQLWAHRHFVWADAKMRAFQTTRGTMLGKVWLVLNPFLQSMIYFVIFGLLLQTSRGVPNFLGYLVIGFNFFSICQGALVAGSTAIKSSENLIRAFAFPRATVVLAWVVRSFLDFLPIYAATLIFIIVIPPHATPTLLWLLTVPLLFIGYLFAFGLALFTSAITALLPDMKFIWPMISRFWFYVSGIFFSLDRFNHLPTVKTIMEVNPAYVFLDMSRDLLLYAKLPSLETWVYFFLWSLILSAIGFIVFWAGEERYGQPRQDR